MNISIRTILFCFMLAFIVINSCSDSDNKYNSKFYNENTGSDRIVTFNYNFTAVHNSKNDSSLKRVPENLKGTMTINNLDAMTSESTDWYMTIDQSAFTASSNKTYILDPGVYEFNLVLDADSGNHQYAGTSGPVIITDDENSEINMVIRPVIGEINSEFDLSELAGFRLAYSDDELALLTEPKIGLSVDGGPIYTFSINATSGVFEGDASGDPTWSSIYLTLAPGSYHLDLSLFDVFQNGLIQVGRSIASQEDVTVYKDDIIMDLSALYSEVFLNLPVEGGTGEFNISFPSDIVDEVGGLSELDLIFVIVDDNAPFGNGIRWIHHYGPWNIESNETYSTIINIPNLVYGTGLLSFFFIDNMGTPSIFDNKLVALAYTSNGFVIPENVDNVLIIESIMLQRNVVQVPEISEFGLSVVDASGNPIPGAFIYANDELIGISGIEGTFGTAGYFNSHLTAGSYTIQAWDASASLLGSTSVNITPPDSIETNIIISATCDSINCGLHGDCSEAIVSCICRDG